MGHGLSARPSPWVPGPAGQQVNICGPSGTLCQMAGWLVCSFLHSAAVPQGRPTCQPPFIHPRHVRIHLPISVSLERSQVTTPQLQTPRPGC